MAPAKEDRTPEECSLVAQAVLEVQKAKKWRKAKVYLEGTSNLPEVPLGTVKSQREFKSGVVVHGDCLAYLKTIPDNYYDSVPSDVPYGLGTREPTADEIVQYIQGNLTLNTGGDFMDTDWSIPSVQVWREVYRVLKPGAHLAIFGGTRTFDLISLGLRAAGFELRDSLGGALAAWVKSQGMPKSTNIANEVKRIGLANIVDLDEAAKVGTGLKPAFEPIMLFRKPLEGRLADNYAKYGTGVLQIDRCRVAHSSASDLENHQKQVEAIKAKGGVRGDSWKNTSDLSGANDVNTGGRWPPNLVLVHLDGCSLKGASKFKGSAASKEFHPAYEGISDTGLPRGYSHPGNQHAGPDGLETSDVWECEEGCQVKILNDQAGNRKSTLAGRADPNASHKHRGKDASAESMFFGAERTHLGNVYADSGPIARFYPQFESLPVDNLSTHLFYSTTASRREATLEGQIVNNHPCKKPLRLMQWVTKLITPPGGRVLDMYCGSGSTLHAAVLEGFQYTGVELNEAAYTTSVERMTLVDKGIELDKKTGWDDWLGSFGSNFEVFSGDKEG